MSASARLRGRGTRRLRGATAVLATVILGQLGTPPAEAALSITVPGAVSLGSGTAGQQISGSLGQVTVTATGPSTAWEATVSLSASFTVAQSGRSHTIPDSRVAYWSGAGSVPLGAVCLPGPLLAVNAVPLGSPRTAFRCTSAPSSLTWSPGIVVTTQSGDPSGTYAGTITHSVA